VTKGGSVKMTFDNSHISPAPPRSNNGIEKLGRLQTEFMSEALRQAVDDAGAAMMHQLREPLTVLLFYLHEIKRAREFGSKESIPGSLSEIVDMALRETERVCAIVEHNDKVVEAPVDVEAAIARGREAINAWASKNRARVEQVETSTRRANSHPLTPREHEVLALIIGGYSNKEGGHRLGISTRTFEAHRAHLMGKLGTRNAADLVRVTLGTLGPVQSEAEELTLPVKAAG
jgi:DNA-binding CsgD family transcriptional regulator